MSALPITWVAATALRRQLFHNRVGKCIAEAVHASGLPVSLSNRSNGNDRVNALRFPIVGSGNLPPSRWHGEDDLPAHASTTALVLTRRWHSVSRSVDHPARPLGNPFDGSSDELISVLLES